MFGRRMKADGTVALIALSFTLVGTLSFAPTAVSETLKGAQMEDKNAAKDSNVAEAQRLNGDDATSNNPAQAAKEAKKQAKEALKSDAQAKANGSTKPTPAQHTKAKETASVVNQVPGVKVNESDLEPPAQPPIHGFHPIKKLLRPVENLEGMSIKLEQQIMKLEGPIAGLQPPMIGLQKKMVKVDDNLGTVHGQLTSMQGEMTGVRSDIAAMRKDINDLKEPIVSLKDPIGSVAKPLERVQALLALVLTALLIMAIAIPVGTPIAAIFIYRNRHKLFPDLSDHEMPKVVEPKEPVGSARH